MNKKLLGEMRTKAAIHSKIKADRIVAVRKLIYNRELVARITKCFDVQATLELEKYRQLNSISINLALDN